MKETPCFSSLQQLHPEASIYCGTLSNPSTTNQQLLDNYLQHHNSPDTRKTHHFMGRFENTYLSVSQVPAMQTILQMAEHYTNSITGHDASSLRRGFWFNEMHPGQSTSLHTHEENDEVLSAVYYITTPKDSGQLVVKLDEEELRITPHPGQMILFAPDIPHSVERNDSSDMRLSVAINFGLDNP